MVLQNVIFESNVCAGSTVVSAPSATPTVSYTSVFGHSVGAGITGVLTDSASFVNTTGTWADWDLHLGETSLLKNAGDPALFNFDGTTSDLGAYGGPGGDFTLPQ